MGNMNHFGSHAADVRRARAELVTMPPHIEGLIFHASKNTDPKHFDVYHNCIVRCTRSLFRAAATVYPKRMADPRVSQ